MFCIWLHTVIRLYPGTRSQPTAPTHSHIIAQNATLWYVAALLNTTMKTGYAVPKHCFFSYL